MIDCKEKSTVIGRARTAKVGLNESAPKTVLFRFVEQWVIKGLLN